jgi:hypothetical protein
MPRRARVVTPRVLAPVAARIAELRDKEAEVARGVSDQGWGLLAAIRLPEGAELPIYEPRHGSPLQL